MPETTTTLNIRKIPTAGAAILKSAARARGLTLPQYLHRLALLHEAVRKQADEELASSAGCVSRTAEILEELGLQTVRA